jgi:hypothetical protein
MAYYSTAGPVKGPMKLRDVPVSLGVWAALDDDVQVGQAHFHACDDEGRAVFCLVIGGNEVPGRWIIVDRKFILVKENGRSSRG